MSEFVSGNFGLSDMLTITALFYRRHLHSFGMSNCGAELKCLFDWFFFEAE